MVKGLDIFGSLVQEMKVRHEQKQVDGGASKAKQEQSY